jgi:hypothetical protein
MHLRGLRKAVTLILLPSQLPFSKIGVSSASGFVWTPASYNVHEFRHHHYQPYSSSLHQAKPKSGSIVDSYQTVSVNCSKCGTKLFRYKKKNGTKSNLVKLYKERIIEDYHGLLQEDTNEQRQQQQQQDNNNNNNDWECPTCQTSFARPAIIHGRPALKLVGGKTRMTKK